MARTPNVISHWQTAFEDFSTSPLEFYALVEEAVARREIPDVTISRVEWKERGLLSDRRTYLRLCRGNLMFDICAAPFGTGFFFSSWCATGRSPIAPLFYLLVALFSALFVGGYFVRVVGGFAGVVLSPLMVLLTWFLLGASVNSGFWGSQDTAEAMPILGKVYTTFFRPATYFSVDTEAMFESGIHAAVLEAVHAVTDTYGKRISVVPERKRIAAR